MADRTLIPETESNNTATELDESIADLRRQIETAHAARLPLFDEQRQALDAAIVSTQNAAAGLAAVRSDLAELRAAAVTP
jgi:hypothetical protein